jgi:alkylated DNA repair dioxygenase AlkB
MSQTELFQHDDHFPDDQLEYHPGFFGQQESIRLMAALLSTIQWKQETLHIYGRQVKTPRLTAWYGDEGVSYTYSGRQFLGLPWTKELLDIKARIEPITQTTFNSVLLNYYRDGNDSMGWHSDDEPELGINPIIASVNFGQERRFDLRKTTDHHKKHSVVLADGSLLVMKGDLQHHWQHQVAKSKKAMGARINLTFRFVS